VRFEIFELRRWCGQLPLSFLVRSTCKVMRWSCSELHVGTRWLSNSSISLFGLPGINFSFSSWWHGTIQVSRYRYDAYRKGNVNCVIFIRALALHKRVAVLFPTLVITCVLYFFVFVLMFISCLQFPYLFLLI